MDAKSNLNNWEDPNYVHPWHDFKLEANHFAMASRGEGIYLYDNNGKRHIDGPGGMWCVNLGYGRTEIADAIADQAKRLPYCSPWYYTNEPAADLAKQIAQRTPGDLNNVFFTTCGSTAIDSALRFVQFYFNFLDKPQKKTIIARDKGYHGSTYLAASVSGKERDKRKLDTISNNISFLSDVNPNLRDKDETVEEWCENKVNELENRILELGAKAGVTLNPATPVENVKHVLHLVDQILIMSVNPGFGGQKYLPSQETKIEKVKSWTLEQGYEIDIEVDGGISASTIAQATCAGANVFVAGSAIFSHPDGPQTAIAELRETAASGK